MSLNPQLLLNNTLPSFNNFEINLSQPHNNGSTNSTIIYDNNVNQFIVSQSQALNEGENERLSNRSNSTPNSTNLSQNGKFYFDLIFNI